MLNDCLFTFGALVARNKNNADGQLLGIRKSDQAVDFSRPRVPVLYSSRTSDGAAVLRI